MDKQKLTLSLEIREKVKDKYFDFLEPLITEIRNQVIKTGKYAEILIMNAEDLENLVTSKKFILLTPGYHTRNTDHKELLIHLLSYWGIKEIRIEHD